MNRSGRRTLAMSWTVAVGVVSAGVVMGSGQAAADDGAGGTAGRGADGTATPGNSAPRRLERSSRDAKTAARGTWRRPHLTEGATADHTHPGHPDVDCHWPEWNPVFIPFDGVGGGGGRGLILAAPAVGPAPLIASPPVSGSATARTLTGLTPLEADGAAPQDAGVAAPLTAPLGGPLLPSPAPPGPPVQAPPPPPVPPTAPAPAVVEPQPAAAQGNPIRLGYPAYIQAASIAEITALAFLGSAGLVALAGAGGFVGYRQAKTGFALRAAGTARFL